MKNTILLLSLITLFSGYAQAQLALVVAEQTKRDAAASVKSCVHEQYDLVQKIAPMMKKINDEDLKLHQCKLQEGFLPFYKGSVTVLMDAFKNRNFDNLEVLNKAFAPFMKIEDGSFGWDFPSIEYYSADDILHLYLAFAKDQKTMLEIKDFYSKPERLKETNSKFYPSKKELSKISNCKNQFNDLVIAEKNLSSLLKQNN